MYFFEKDPLKNKIIFLGKIIFLTGFYHQPIGLVLFTHSLKDASENAQVELNYKLNYFV